MRQLNIFWYESSNLFDEVIEEIELIGHKVIKSLLANDSSIKERKFDFAINVPENLQKKISFDNFLFIQHSYIPEWDKQNLPSFSSVSAYDQDNLLVMHHWFENGCKKSDFINRIVDFFIEYSKSDIAPKVKERVYSDTLEFEDKNSLEIVLSAIKLVYGFDKVTVIEEMKAPNVGLCKTLQVDFTSLADKILNLALKWDVISPVLCNVNSMIQVKLRQDNTCRITHVYKHKFQKGFLEYLLNVKDNKEQFLSEEEQSKKIIDIKNIIPVKSSIIEEIYNNVVNTPNKVAVEDQNFTLTYAKLWERVEIESNNILLYNKNINGKAIAIGMQKSCDLIISLLAILRCCAYYVPLDPSYPIGRVSKILATAKPALVIIDDEFEQKNANILDEFNVVKAKNLRIPTSPKMLVQYPKPKDLSYVIFTSGSTGNPKGVMIEHRNVVNLAKSEAIALKLNTNSRFLSVASIGFDAAGWDIYGALINGCTVVIAPEQIQIDPVALAKFIISNNVTIATLTPAVLSTLSPSCAKSLDILIVMGDKCSNQIMDRWCKYTKVMNGYGPTEATIGASLNVYYDGQSNLCIGKPLKNYVFLVMNEKQQLLPKETVGELYIAGSGLARGYLNDYELTKASFVEKRVLDQNIRLYRTGDLVFQNQEGFFEFVGRKDYQIKIRGVRIELEEIEKVLNTYEGIHDSVTKVQEPQKLVAYIQSEGKIELTELNKYLAQFLHPAAIPTKFFRVKQFNLTHNGKIDRKNIDGFVEIKTEKILLPQNSEQNFVYKVFQDVLNISNFSINDNFFLLGGHSLTAVNVIGQINKHFKAKLPLHLLFKVGTVEDIADKIKDYISTESPLIKSPSRTGSLTFAQERLWYLYQLDQNDVSYNLPFVLEIKGDLDKLLLEKSLQYIIERHETFRTIFEVEEGVKQKVLKKIDFFLETKKYIKNIDLFIENYCYKTFNLTTEPPFRICLIERNKTDHLLVFVLHNIITDAWSMGIIIKELLLKYRSGTESKISKNDIELLDFQILDAGNYEKQFRTRELKQQELNYWKNQLENHQNLNFPTNQRPELLSNKGSSMLYKFSSDSWQTIKQYAKNKGCTPFTALITVMNMWLAKYSHQTDILIGTALSGREGVEIEKMSGFFVNTLPLRTVFTNDNNFDEILVVTQQTVIDAIANQGATFEWIVELSKAERFINKNPLFHIMVILQNADENILPNIPNLTISNYRVPAKYAMFDMVWNFKEHGKDLEVDLSYNETLYSLVTIQNFLSSLDHFIFTIMSHMNKPLKVLNVLDKRQENQIVECSFSRVADFGDKVTIIDKIFESYYSSPNSVAVKDKKGSYTYKQLIYAASSVAQKIQLHTGGRNIGIGVHMERSFDLVASILGILMSGAYYVPLDPTYPNERLLYIIDNAKLKLVIVDKHYDNLTNYQTLNISELLIDNSTDSKFTLKKNRQDNIVYVIYTSGTTGLPKGIIISHKNIYNLCDDFCNILELGANSEFLSITTMSFDIFALELFCPLMSGAVHHIVTSDIARNPVHLVNLIKDAKPTHIQATPTMWRTIIDHVEDTEITILCGGESLDKSLFKKFKNKFGKAYNVYGPTETTVWSTYTLISECDEISIGKPIQNTQCFILDENEQLCPFDVWGELVIAGDGVGKGYINNTELTKKVFQEVEIAGQKLLVYKTGDRAKLLNDNSIICLGRFDSQIKLRGNRIELQEIESVLNQLDFVSISAVKLWGDGNNAYLAAYIVLSNALDEEEAIELIKTQISEKLSPIMIPANFQILDHLPKTNNGKIDRKSLVEPTDNAAFSENQFVHPRNEKEEFIKNIWKKTINITDISVVDNFFIVGGNSIHIPQIVHELNQHYTIDLTIRDFILHSTIRELSEYIKNKVVINIQ